MNKGAQFLFVGGPLHGSWQPVDPGISTVQMAEFPLMAYHRNHVPTGGSMDPDWFMRNLPEPTSIVVFEWHERLWVSPAVAAIRGAVDEATERVFGDR